MVFLDKYKFPVETTKGRFVGNIIRLIIHTRYIKFGYWDGYKIIKKRRNI